MDVWTYFVRSEPSSVSLCTLTQSGGSFTSVISSFCNRFCKKKDMEGIKTGRNLAKHQLTLKSQLMDPGLATRRTTSNLVTSPLFFLPSLLTSAGSFDSNPARPLELSEEEADADEDGEDDRDAPSFLADDDMLSSLPLLLPVSLIIVGTQMRDLSSHQPSINGTTRRKLHTQKKVFEILRIITERSVSKRKKERERGQTRIFLCHQ